jgi:NAD(P)-dependent dehydrogenase (short-subunit alcohol dehydrogenase family)
MNSNLMEPEGKTALVAGPTPGTGKATASALARLDAMVIVTGRNAEPAALPVPVRGGLDWSAGPRLDRVQQPGSVSCDDPDRLPHLRLPSARRPQSRPRT